MAMMMCAMGGWDDGSREGVGSMVYWTGLCRGYIQQTVACDDAC